MFLGKLESPRILTYLINDSLPRISFQMLINRACLKAGKALMVGGDDATSLQLELSLHGDIPGQHFKPDYTPS